MGECTSKKILGEVKMSEGGAERNFEGECLIDGVVGEDKGGEISKTAEDRGW